MSTKFRSLYYEFFRILCKEVIYIAVIDYISNNSFVGNQSLQNFERCYPMQKNIWLILTNEQVCLETFYAADA